MNRILVPTDFSDCANVAVEYAVEIAKKTSADVTFIHSMYTPVDWRKIPLEKERQFPETKSQIAQAKITLNKLIKQAEKQGIKANYLLIYDSGREEIEAHIIKSRYDLVVIGSHGAKGVKEIIGSNTQKIVRHSPVPVLVVKRKPAKIQFDKIVFAADFETNLKASFSKVANFAEAVSGQLHILYVNTPYNFKETDEVENAMKTFMLKSKIKPASMSIYNAENVESGVEKYALSIDADVIALATHGKSGFINMFTTSITESLVNHSQTPVLSVHLNKS